MSTIYCIYVRNHSESGTFSGVMVDLDRITQLGVDWLWFMPIHPIGQRHKKGELGSPYAIRDYRAINPEYGTIADFQELLEQAHRRELKVMIDVVFHHTAHDSLLVTDHPDFFYRTVEGTFGNKVGDWTDIIDLDFTQQQLWQELISSLVYWLELGVDGFRCDVASLIPLQFWEEARRQLEQVNPNVVLLAESIHGEFVHYMRSRGFVAHADGELYPTFDLTYDYDVHQAFSDYVSGVQPLEHYLYAKRQQLFRYAKGSRKLRFLENHDIPRAASLFADSLRLMNWTAFMLFEQGTALLYAGQEARCQHLPNLFNRDPIDWSNLGSPLERLIRQMIALKKSAIMQFGHYELAIASSKFGVIEASYQYNDELVIGIFRVEVGGDSYPLQSAALAKQQVNWGNYQCQNVLNGMIVNVQDGCVTLDDAPMILQIRKKG
jgi:glycosidase